MNVAEIKQMRKNQYIFLNTLLIAALILFYCLIRTFEITYSHFFLFLGVLLIVQAIIGFLKRDSTKSIFPIIEKVAKYEKEKMGSEWKKQRIIGYVWNVLLGGFMLFRVYWDPYLGEDVMKADFQFWFILLFIFTLLLNVSMLLHIRKVDRSTSVADLKGYTWKSNALAVCVGVILAFLFMVIIIFYVFTI
ncbi:hypothetical protein [Sutcliffiella halmapala]|uniref:hypothetical protein n=1 Tax=Sutcliffiella halmapala TaxID=79882 RepID=UPI0009959626|nr:hypothetical protein [Sutcliffiella halmapala]